MQVFEQAGLKSPILGSIVIGLVNVAGTVVAALVMDRCGRKPLLLISHFGMAVSLASISLALRFICESVSAVCARLLSHAVALLHLLHEIQRPLPLWLSWTCTCWVAEGAVAMPCSQPHSPRQLQPGRHRGLCPVLCAWRG